MPSENTIYFYPGRGGHSHDGNNSSFIDTSVYSLFDFSWGLVGDPDRIASQRRNYDAFSQFIIETVNRSVLEPAGLVLQPGMVNGSAHIISRSIEANLIAANAITANEIAAGTITADELASNIVLVNNYITSSNFDGVIAANGAVTSAGTVGWAVTSYGHAVFDTTFIRGSLVASSVSTPGVDILSNGTLIANTFALYGNGALVTSSGNFSVDASGNLTANNANITGTIYGSAGQIAGWTIDGNNLTASGFPGYITIGPTAYSATGEAGMEIAYGTYQTNMLSGGILFQGEDNLIDITTSSPAQITVSDGASSTLISATSVETTYLVGTNFGSVGNQIQLMGIGINYPEATYGPGSPNAMALTWNSPNIYGVVDNVVYAVLGTVSDERSKSYIADAEDIWLDKIYNDLRVVSFNPVDLLDDDNMHLYPRRLGLIAQEVNNSLPNLVVSADPYDNDAFLSVDCLGLVPYLIQTVQDLNNRIKELENRV